ncbi:MAG: hypothetical protein IPF51_12405 [Dehalococcoidia bacterium]|uniref:hypothetical protein n=1 Tax=Candidatus Amarobacter glycogenicus TaxID=3140699 RepID=UPI0031351890|nr:hypothetical protein [Dehalococcoidia bacterium]
MDGRPSVSSGTARSLPQLAGAGVPVIGLHDSAEAHLIADMLSAGAHACLDLGTDARVVSAQVRAVLPARRRI